MTGRGPNGVTECGFRSRSRNQVSDRGFLPPIAELRREYARARLDESYVSPDPIAEFDRWFTEACDAQVSEPNAMALATATREGTPSVRIVLLKAYDERGFAFFTDYRSRKGAELEQNPQAALVLYWAELERQIRITGPVSVVSREESEAYFQSRPRSSRLSTWISHQSQVIAGREVLDDRERQLRSQFPDDVPLPPHWGGYRVTPETVEFWQGRPSRLHDRLRYMREKGGGWRLERLSP
jgi:pyridoxamine 5'-phosphate oxidase